jgi:hypothetical protein
MRYTSTSLYRYAGGKNKMKDEIIKIIDEIHPNLERMMSPFMGGGCIELSLAARGVKVQAYDLFQPLADFWEILTTEGGKGIAEEAANKADEFVSFITTNTNSDTYNKDSDITVVSVPNLQAVMILKPIQGETIYNGDASALTAQGKGEFFLCSDIGSSGMPYADHYSETATHNVQLTSLSVRYGSISYPASPIEIQNSANVVDFTGLYNEYLKTLNVVGNRVAKPLPYSVFSTTMPFACISFWSNNGAHLTQQGQDLRISMKGGQTTTSLPIVRFQLQVAKIGRDGSISLMM